MQEVVKTLLEAMPYDAGAMGPQLGDLVAVLFELLSVVKHKGSLLDFYVDERSLIFLIVAVR